MLVYNDSPLRHRRALCCMFFINDLRTARALLLQLRAGAGPTLNLHGTDAGKGPENGQHTNPSVVSRVLEEYPGHVADVTLALRLLANSLQCCALLSPVEERELGEMEDEVYGLLDLVIPPAELLLSRAKKAGKLMEMETLLLNLARFVDGAVDVITGLTVAHTTQKSTQVLSTIQQRHRVFVGVEYRGNTRLPYCLDVSE